MNDAEQRAGLAPTPGYRYADVVGKRLYVAGQVPNDADGRLIGAADPGAQARACLDNLATLVRVRGFALGDVRRLTIYVAGEHHDLRAAWAAVLDWFGGEVPPATLLGVRLLGYAGQLVEVDATVERGG